MEPNEQTEVTWKTETDSWMESRMTASGGGGGWSGVGGIEQKGRTHGHVQQCGDC